MSLLLTFGIILQGILIGLIARLLPKHIREQAEYRADKCRPCLAEGRCLHCTCKTPQVFYAPRKKDKLDKWGPMLNREEWEARKKQLNNDNDSDTPDNNSSSN